MSQHQASVPVKFECMKCGGSVLELPDNPTDDSVAVCKSCRAELGRWGDIKEAAAKTVGEAAVQSMKDSLKKAFSGSDFIKFK